jgi:ABC-type nickel/cobalt efflux system permease component RcnA
VEGLDDLIAGWSDGGSLVAVLAIALLLGLRHATDPDHLVAVSTLVATEPERPLRRAGILGLAWGAGHATTLLVLGLPVVLLGADVPPPLQEVAELLVGLVVMALGLRLLLRWRAGRFHAHVHVHDGVVHRHLHDHEHAGHEHGHVHALARSPAQAFGVGLVHGIGGSAAVGVLLLVSIGQRLDATIALLTFAAGTAASMVFLSAGVGFALARAGIERLRVLAPVLGTVGLSFGAWYAAGAFPL